MQGIAHVIAAVNVILRHLGELPDGAEVRELRETALGYINEVVLWTTTVPPVETREALMKKVLDLHVSVSRRRGTLPVGVSLGPNESIDAPSAIRHPSSVPPA